MISFLLTFLGVLLLMAGWGLAALTLYALGHVYAVGRRLSVAGWLTITVLVLAGLALCAGGVRLL